MSSASEARFNLSHDRYYTTVVLQSLKFQWQRNMFEQQLGKAIPYPGRTLKSVLHDPDGIQ